MGPDIGNSRGGARSPPGLRARVPGAVRRRFKGGEVYVRSARDFELGRADLSAGARCGGARDDGRRFVDGTKGDFWPKAALSL